MRKSKFSEHQIIAILKAVEAGRTVKDVCREHEISEATYYQWKSKYGGMEAADIRRLRELNETLAPTHGADVEVIKGYDEERPLDSLAISGHSSTREN